MENFDYLAPRTLDEAFAALATGRSSLFLAGGTDVIVQLREGRKRADQVIDVKHIPELMSLGWAADGTLEIGAAVSCARLYEDAEVARRLPAVVDAAHIIGGTQIQSRASFGGNLCNASPAADAPPALIALGAELVIGAANGKRTLPVADFFTGVGHNALQPGEILLQIRIPAQPPRSAAYYHRFIPRNEMDIAVASAGVWLQLGEDGRIAAARIALGAVAPTPLPVPAAAEALVGAEPGAAAFEAAGKAAGAATSPISDMRGSVAQRRHLAAVLTRRALEGALTRIPEAR